LFKLWHYFSSPLPPPLSHSLALVNPHTTDAAARYLSSDERVLAVKAEAPPTAMFVLCVFSSGTAILEIVNSIKQNVNLTATIFQTKQLLAS
jgi:hypothetical protein